MEKKDTPPGIKIVMMGDANVGKTHIVAILTGKKDYKGPEPTVALDI